jgi:hypothetical protein
LRCYGVAILLGSPRRANGSKGSRGLGVKGGKPNGRTRVVIQLWAEAAYITGASDVLAGCWLDMKQCMPQVCR